MLILSEYYSNIHHSTFIFICAYGSYFAAPCLAGGALGVKLFTLCINTKIKVLWVATFLAPYFVQGDMSCLMQWGLDKEPKFR
jgi:hypothetical protein